jgi:hypothetical protein
MEWNRGARPSQPASVPVGHPAGTSGSHKKSSKFEGLLSLRLASVLLLFSATIVIVGLVWLMVFSRPANEAKQVKSDRMQAVFLNGGQVYFGRIGDLNEKYMTINDIYYLRVNQQVQPNQQGSQTSNDISLVKLGCELHGPEDSMVVNREMVIFWENLKTDGQVAKAVDEYKKQNPDGQKCETAASNQTQPSTTNTNTTNTTNTNTTNTSNSTRR